jgi:hypothetical protein
MSRAVTRRGREPARERSYGTTAAPCGRGHDVTESSRLECDSGRGMVVVRDGDSFARPVPPTAESGHGRSDPVARLLVGLGRLDVIDRRLRGTTSAPSKAAMAAATSGNASWRSSAARSSNTSVAMNASASRRSRPMSNVMTPGTAWLADCTAASRPLTSSALPGEHRSLNRTTITGTPSCQRTLAHQDSHPAAWRSVEGYFSGRVGGAPAGNSARDPVV